MLNINKWMLYILMIICSNLCFAARLNITINYPSDVACKLMDSPQTAGAYVINENNQHAIKISMTLPDATNHDIKDEEYTKNTFTIDCKVAQLKVAQLKMAAFVIEGAAQHDNFLVNYKQRFNNAEGYRVGTMSDTPKKDDFLKEGKNAIIYDNKIYCVSLNLDDVEVLDISGVHNLQFNENAVKTYLDSIKDTLTSKRLCTLDDTRRISFEQNPNYFGSDL